MQLRRRLPFDASHLQVSLVNFFLLIDAQATGTHIDKQQQSANDRESLEKVVPTIRHLPKRIYALKEISMWMSFMHTPKIIDQDVGYAQ